MTTHGHTRNRRRSPAYVSWLSMKDRVTSRVDYLERNITIEDPRWWTFTAFIADMGERPAGTTLDRVDNAKGYCKSNCRWAPAWVQNRNRRPRRTS